MPTRIESRAYVGLGGALGESVDGRRGRDRAGSGALRRVGVHDKAFPPPADHILRGSRGPGRPGPRLPLARRYRRAVFAVPRTRVPAIRKASLHHGRLGSQRPANHPSAKKRFRARASHSCCPDNSSSGLASRGRRRRPGRPAPRSHSLRRVHAVRRRSAGQARPFAARRSPIWARASDISSTRCAELIEGARQVSRRPPRTWSTGPTSTSIATRRTWCSRPGPSSSAALRSRSPAAGPRRSIPPRGPRAPDVRELRDVRRRRRRSSCGSPTPLGLRIEARMLYYRTADLAINAPGDGHRPHLRLRGQTRATHRSGRRPDRRIPAPIRPRVPPSMRTAVPWTSDGDGVLDGLDKCQNTPKGCTVDARRLPDRLPDGDGVCDGSTRCPDAPGRHASTRPAAPRTATAMASSTSLDQVRRPCAQGRHGRTPRLSRATPTTTACRDGIDQCPDTSPGLKVDDEGLPDRGDREGDRAARYRT